MRGRRYHLNSRVNLWGDRVPHVTSVDMGRQPLVTEHAAGSALAVHAAARLLFGKDTCWWLETIDDGGE